MKLNLKAATVALVFSLLTACGGGGNGGGTASLDNSRLSGLENQPGISNSPLQLSKEIGHTVSEQDNLVYFSLSRIDPRANEQQNTQSLSPARTVALLSNNLTDEIDEGENDPGENDPGENDPDDNDDEPNNSAFDWHHKNTFALDLIKFAGLVGKTNNQSLYEDSEIYKGYIKYTATLPVSYNEEPISLPIFGVRNKSGGEEFILFDAYAGLVSGGAQLNGIPSGQHTYKGYNFFRYTPHSGDPYEGYSVASTRLQHGDFEMDVDFNAGTGTISAISGLNWLTFGSKNTKPGTKLSGDITVDATNGVFAGKDLVLTEILLEDEGLQSDKPFKGYEVIPVGELGSAKIQGMFHGNEGEGVSGIYRHDVDENEQFRGAIVGNQNSNGTYPPVIQLVPEVPVILSEATE